MNHIGPRAHAQQGRIKDGIQSGQINPDEMTNIKSQRAANKSALDEAKANGASPEELRAQRQEMLNGLSQSIAQYTSN